MPRSQIPIQNIYFLLCYAWNKLEQGQIVDISNSPTTSLVDLFALVLCDGVRHSAKRGLAQGYIPRTEELSGIRGRIELSASSRRALFVVGRAICTYDELTPNILTNQVIRATIARILTVETLDRDLRKKCLNTLKQLHGIESVSITSKHFGIARASTNDRFQKFLLHVCELAHHSLIPDESTGRTKFSDFSRDDNRMAALFQQFLFGFIKRECPAWSVKIENISWSASSETDANLALLPRMQTDISIWKPGKYIIIDAKYYGETLSSFHQSRKVHSAHLYQMMSYLQNASPRLNAEPQGMLLYPQVDTHLRQEYRILGKTISVCTVDLSRHWSEVDREIRMLLD